jgi:hypothetical protein
MSKFVDFQTSLIDATIYRYSIQRQEVIMGPFTEIFDYINKTAKELPEIQLARNESCDEHELFNNECSRCFGWNILRATKKNSNLRQKFQNRFVQQRRGNRRLQYFDNKRKYKLMH